ncbi:hypothetical protein VTN96DRAFT_1806 [Rasamsonia emersonii]|uniref:GDP/GTP exchange factor Sec2 N-terminal domain-containing protein n=1 Tax=Rasamsonia emersonii (strain ATCC 16479 / CBS 393.64 / IMI 116815) TaxID=1408163 RepID=A0A0F4YL51_RASE3|nr:hypothetical protein T310_7016 [Rasamsonia emersonii CBS 393.64]KKA19022.1 hypothetical protein T310_7016 [Rasamsonia emersonii CBS 393.64]
MSTTTVTTATKTTTTANTTTLVGDFLSSPSQPPMTKDTSVVQPVSVSPGTVCPHCGQDISLPTSSADNAHDLQAAQQRIQELEAQVKFLTTRAAATAEKLADYEDEIRALRSQAQAMTQTQSHTQTKDSISSISSTSSALPAGAASPQKNISHTNNPSEHHTRLSTFASFLPYRRGTTSTTTTAPAANTTSSSTADTYDPAELQNALSREQSLRKAAESQLSQANLELEELTAQLFSQANEMVAQERKARAKLEERVALLERRDGEKRKRLDRLEKAIERVERVRWLVGQGPPPLQQQQQQQEQEQH